MADTLADRTLPLAERVEAWYWSERTDRGAIGYQEAVDALLADIAAADRLARATVVVADAAEQVASLSRTDRVRVHVEWNAAKTTGDAALAAYRARMAQGVDRG